MSDVTGELILENLKRIQAQIAELREYVIGLGVRTAGIDHVQAGHQLSLSQRGDDIDRLRSRVERIERHLDLVDQ